MTDFISELLNLAAQGKCKDCRFARESKFEHLVWCVARLNHEDEENGCKRFERAA